MASLATQVRIDYDKIFLKDQRERSIGSLLSNIDPIDKSTLNFPYLSPKYLFPKHITIHSRLESPYECFSIKYITSYDEKDDNDGLVSTHEIICDKYLDILQIYWLGYIAFLSELDGNDGDYDVFLNKYCNKIPVQKDTGSYPVSIEYKNFIFKPRLTENNRKEFLETFIVYYALDIWGSSCTDISTCTRLKALKLWKARDGQGELYPSNLCNYYVYGRGECKPTNLLPETFHPGMVENQEIECTDFINNKIIIKFIGPCYLLTVDKFATGLKSLLSEYRQEIAQILHSILRVDIYSQIYRRIALRMLFELLDVDIDSKTLIFGLHASYRNKGRITKKFDDVESMGRDLLVQTVRTQREQLKQKEEEYTTLKTEYDRQIKTLKESHVFPMINNLICTYNSQVDYESWFGVLIINPLLPFHINSPIITANFRREITKWHHDKYENVSAEDKEQAKKHTQNLNIAYENLKEEDGYDNYQEECIRRALILARKMLGLEV